MKPHLQRLQLIAVSFLAVLLLNGCAFTTDHVSLSYVPQPSPGKVDGADKISVKVQVTDVRTTPNKVGAKKNGYGMEMAPIVADGDISEMLEKAIGTELSDRGYHVAPGDITLAVELSKFYNDFKIGFFAGDAVAEVTIDVRVKNAAGDIVYTKLVTGEGLNPNIQLATGNNAKIALEAALQDAIAKLFKGPDFTDSLTKAAKPTF